MLCLKMFFAVLAQMELLSGDSRNISTEANGSRWASGVHCHVYGSGISCFLLFPHFCNFASDYFVVVLCLFTTFVSYEGTHQVNVMSS